MEKSVEEFRNLSIQSAEKLELVQPEDVSGSEYEIRCTEDQCHPGVSWHKREDS